MITKSLLILHFLSLILALFCVAWWAFDFDFSARTCNSVCLSLFNLVSNVLSFAFHNSVNAKLYRLVIRAVWNWIMATLKLKFIWLTFNSYLNIFLTELLYARRTYFNCLSIFNTRLFEHFHHHSNDTLPVILNANLKIGISSTFLHFFTVLESLQRILRFEHTYTLVLYQIIHFFHLEKRYDLPTFSCSLHWPPFHLKLNFVRRMFRIISTPLEIRFQFLMSLDIDIGILLHQHKCTAETIFITLSCLC